jgi:hypothetical protein
MHFLVPHGDPACLRWHCGFGSTGPAFATARLGAPVVCPRAPVSTLDPALPEPGSQRHFLVPPWWALVFPLTQ